MTLILVNPHERWVAADKRACFGQMYTDDFLKFKEVHGAVLAACGGPRLLDVASQVGWDLWNDSPEVIDLSAFVTELRGRLGASGELDNDGDMKGDLVVAARGKAYQIESSCLVYPLTRPIAIGSGAESGQVLLNAGWAPANIFRAVAAVNYTCSTEFDLRRF